jgi:hypothetical protein
MAKVPKMVAVDRETLVRVIDYILNDQADDYYERLEQGDGPFKSIVSDIAYLNALRADDETKSGLIVAGLMREAGKKCCHIWPLAYLLHRHVEWADKQHKIMTSPLKRMTPKRKKKA